MLSFPNPTNATPSRFSIGYVLGISIRGEPIGESVAAAKRVRRGASAAAAIVYAAEEMNWRRRKVAACINRKSPRA
jgi:hypothetical protein